MSLGTWQMGNHSYLPVVTSNGTIMEMTAMQPVSKATPMDPTSIPPIAHQCTLSFCAKEIKSSQQPGKVLKERVSAIHALQFEDCAGQYHRALNETGKSPTCIGVKDTSLSPDAKSDVNPVPRGETLYEVDAQSILDLVYSFQHIIPDLSSSSEIFAKSAGVAVPVLVQDALRTLFANDIGLMLENIAHSLTNWIRDSPEGTLVSGSTWEPVTFVKVAWAWLAYPTGMVASTATFLSISIAFSLQKRNLVWKSSPLALLFHQLQGWNSEDLDVRNRSEMKETAERFWAQLIEDERGSVSFVRA